jgi:transposase
MPRGSFGPRLQATVGYLTGRIGTSQRDTGEMMEALFHTHISLGSIPAVERQVSNALEKPVCEVVTYVQKQAVVNIDETGWKEATKRIWLWVVATALATAFRLLPSRGGDSAEEMLGKDFKGIASTDRWSAYNRLDIRHRQLCWSHLKRDFQAFGDRDGESRQIGAALLKRVRSLFKMLLSAP